MAKVRVAGGCGYIGSAVSARTTRTTWLWEHKLADDFRPSHDANTMTHQVTGGAGLIGATLVEAPLKLSHGAPGGGLGTDGRADADASLTGIRSTSKLSIACPVCMGNRSSLVSLLPFRANDCRLTTEIRGCCHCKSFWRVLPSGFDPAAHFEIASYTNEARGQYWRNARAALFLQVSRLIAKYRLSRSQRPALLDVGCSFGHMMELFAQQGWVCSGVEPVGRLRDDVGSRGFTVYAALEDVPCVPSYDAITFIDSLYYLLEPCLALSRASSMLTSGGVIVVRIANRTPPLRLLRTLRSWRRFADVFSDQIAAISHEGMQAMAHAAGLHVSLLCLREARPVIGRPVAQTWLLYRVVGPLAALTGLRLSPGIIYVLHKARQEDGQHVAARQDGPRVHERSVYYGTDMSQP